MGNITIKDLKVYPLKSSQGQFLEQIEVNQFGLLFDRHWAVIDENSKAVTGRSHPQLMDITTDYHEKAMELNIPGFEKFHLPYKLDKEPTEIIKIFSSKGVGVEVSEALNQAMSTFLQDPVKVIYHNEKSERFLSPKTGGEDGDRTAFADEAPVLIVSQSSLDDLNTRLESPIKMDRFRPNIVLNGTTPYQEDQWEMIKIGSVTFELLRACNRCIFTTIDPITKKAHPNQEPLKTLLSYRKGDPRNNFLGNAVAFGMHFIPRTFGEIKVGDEVEIIK